MAVRTLNPARPFGKLALVRIVSVAIRTLRKRHFLLEISLGVALHALHLRMFSQQRILRFRVIESLRQPRRRNPLPSRCRMARLASLLEAAMMDVRMAVGALPEWNPRISRLPIRSRSVALLAVHLRMQSGQRIACLGVIELLDRGHRPPVFEAMALAAIRSQSPLVRVFVTGGARFRGAKKSSIQVLDLD